MAKQVKFQFTSEGKDQVKSNMNELDKGLSDIKVSGGDAKEVLRNIPDIINDFDGSLDQLGNTIGNTLKDFGDLVNDTGGVKEALSSTALSLLGTGGLIAGFTLLIQYLPDIISFFSDVEESAEDSAEAIEKAKKAVSGLVEVSDQDKFKIDFKVENLDSIISDQENLLKLAKDRKKALEDTFYLIARQSDAGAKLNRDQLSQTENEIRLREAVIEKIKEDKAQYEAKLELKELYKDFLKYPEEEKKKIEGVTNALKDQTKEVVKNADINNVGGSKIPTELELVPTLEKPLIDLWGDDVKKLSDFLGDTVGDVFRSNARNIWEDFFGEANSIGEQILQSLFGNILSNLTSNISSELLSFIPGGSIVSGLLDIFGLGKINPGGSNLSNAGVNSQGILVQIGENQVEKATYKTTVSTIGELQRRRIL